MVQQRRADATVLGQRIYVEMRELVPADPGEPDDSPLDLRHPQFPPRQEPAAEQRPIVLWDAR